MLVPTSYALITRAYLSALDDHGSWLIIFLTFTMRFLAAVSGSLNESLHAGEQVILCCCRHSIINLNMHNES